MKKPPERIPEELLSLFTLNDQIEVQNFYRDDSYLDENSLKYKKEDINNFIEKAKRKDTGGYGDTDLFLYSMLDKYPIFNDNVAIMGSVSPWYESISILYGGKPTTIEYNKIISFDERLKCMTVEEYEKNNFVFDSAISISTFEHDGLGRYGDAINPNGDMQAMLKMKKIIKKNGILFLAVPFGRDRILWNIHRVYGRIRFPMLVDKWEIIDSCGFEDKHYDSESNTYHPVFVLRNI